MNATTQESDEIKSIRNRLNLGVIRTPWLFGTCISRIDSLTNELTQAKQTIDQLEAGQAGAKGRAEGYEDALKERGAQEDGWILQAALEIIRSDAHGLLNSIQIAAIIRRHWRSPKI